ncbi:hypothetical protein NP493_573g01039 [Ridgeia piscesae]|uniref:SEA domain-containing protein n=1 Tax=Ridgeia piscesae TaxID=27915 RepID=A0AAD9KUI0_RIDPI|nr:hypothetical protein NP493_573g01039 [Ridgeia piscesae]
MPFFSSIKDRKEDVVYENDGYEYGQQAGANSVNPSSSPEPPDPPSPPNPVHRPLKWSSCSRGLVLLLLLPALVIAGLVGVILCRHTGSTTSPQQRGTFHATMALDKLHYDVATYGNPDSPMYQKLTSEFCLRVMTSLINRNIVDDVPQCKVSGFSSASSDCVMVYFTIVARYWNVPLKGERQTTTEDMAITIRDQIREEAEKENGLFHQYLHRENVTIIVTAASVDSTISMKNVKSTETRLPVKQTTGAELKTVGLTRPSNEPTTTSEDMTTTIKQQTTPL